jgi:hypothetical protein
MKNSRFPLCPSAARALRGRVGGAALFGLTLLLWEPVQAQFALPIYESFPGVYTNGGAAITVNGASWPGTGLIQPGIPSTAVWTWGSSGKGNITNIGAAALSYPGLYQTDGSVGAYVSDLNVSGARSAGIQLTTLNSGAVYVSFLLNVQTWPTNVNRLVWQMNSAVGLGGSDLFGFLISTTNTTTGISNRVYVVKHGSSTSIVNNTVPPEAPSITAGTTHLIVVRYTFNPSDSDELAMWVDPGSLGVAESNVPTPSTTTTTGTDITGFSMFALFLQNSAADAGSSLFFDELRLGRTWASVTPTSASCDTAFIQSNPTNLSVVEGGMATFTTIGGGTAATYQWQISTDGGATWNPLTTGVGTNAASLNIPSVGMAQNGNRYRCHLAVGCDGSVTNSTAAILTVTAPVVTPPGVVLDDSFVSRDRLTGPVTSTHSVWYTDTASSLFESADPDPYMLQGLPQAGTSCVWLGYFTDSSAAPVHLDVGSALKATLVFTAQGTVSGTNSLGLRIGLFDDYDAGIRFTYDTNAVKNSGANVQGYMFAQDWETVFSADEPQTIYARNNLADPNLMGATGDFLTLGHSSAGFLNAPGFSDGTIYTVDLYVARMSTSWCSICMSVSGGGTNYTTTLPDTSYGYHRFDCLTVRPASADTTANEFDFTEFKVQVLQIPSRPQLNIAKSGANVTLSWTNPALYAPFRLAQATTVVGTYNPIANSASPYTVGATNQARFFRLVWP